MLMKRNVDLSIGFVPETGQNIISLPLYDDPFLIVIHPSVISKYFPDRKTTVFSLDDHKTLKEIIENCPSFASFTYDHWQNQQRVFSV